LMEEKLRQEGIVVQNDQILQFNAVFWNPIEELSL